MKYGLVTLTNYLPTGQIDLSRFDQLDFVDLPKKLDKAALLDAVHRNWLNIDQSVERLQCVGKLYTTLPHFEQLDGCTRRIQAVYLDQVFPGLSTRPQLWATKGEALLKHPRLQRVVNRIVGARRFGRMEFVQRVGEPLDPRTIPFLMHWWTVCRQDVPVAGQRRSSGMAYYLFTSSLPGRTAQAKLKVLASYPRAFRQMLVLVADDVSIPHVLKLAERACCRATYDVGRVRDADGRVIGRTHKLYQALKRTWADNPGSTGYCPIVFNTRAKLFERLVRHFTLPAPLKYRNADRVLVKTTSTVDNANLIQL